MESFEPYLKPELIWFVIGLLLLIFEFINPGVILIFFGFGAWLVALICLFTEISLNTQLIVFLISSIIFLIFLRKDFKKMFAGRFEEGQVDDDYEHIEGKKAIVVEKIEPNKRGRVEFQGTSWFAEADENLKVGSVVEIVKKENLTLVVKKVTEV